MTQPDTWHGDILTTIEILECEKQTKQVQIMKFTQFGRSPNDEEFWDMAKLHTALQLISVRLDEIVCLEQTLRTNHRLDQPATKL